MGDAGLTGRKIIVDTYGGWGAHGGDTSYSLAFFNICNGFGCYILQSSFFTGGAFSGKDYTKVDRSAAYAARWVAKSLVKAGLCKRVLVQVSGCRPPMPQSPPIWPFFVLPFCNYSFCRFPMLLVLPSLSLSQSSTTALELRAAQS